MNDSSGVNPRPALKLRSAFPSIVTTLVLSVLWSASPASGQTERASAPASVQSDVPSVVQAIRAHSLEPPFNALLFRSEEKFSATRPVPRGGPVSSIPRADQVLDFTYQFGGQTGTNEASDRAWRSGAEGRAGCARRRRSRDAVWRVPRCRGPDAKRRRQPDQGAVQATRSTGVRERGGASRRGRARCTAIGDPAPSRAGIAVTQMGQPREAQAGPCTDTIIVGSVRHSMKAGTASRPCRDLAR